MDILDDNIIQESEPDYPLRSPKFIKRIRIFSIITLANAVVLFLFPILFVFIVILNRQYIHEREILLIVVSILLFMAGGVLLYKSFLSARAYVNTPTDRSHLEAAMRWFFYFWLLLIGSILLMIILSIYLGF